VEAEEAASANEFSSLERGVSPSNEFSSLERGVSPSVTISPVLDGGEDGSSPTDGSDVGTDESEDGAGDAEGAPVLFDDVGYDDDVGLAVKVGFGDTVGGIVVLIVGRGVTTRSSAGGVAIWMPEGCVGMMVGTFDASVGIADGGCVDIVSKEIFGMVGRGSVEL